MMALPRAVGVVVEYAGTYGFVECDDGRRFFLHAGAIHRDGNGARDVRVGQRVRFRIKPHHRGPLAVSVRPIPTPNEESDR